MGKHLRTPKSTAEFITLVDDALFEVADPREAGGYDEENPDVDPRLIAGIEEDLRALKEQLAGGDYQCGGGNLPFMAPVARQPIHALPFKGLLEIINASHRHGLERGA